MNFSGVSSNQIHVQACDGANDDQIQGEQGKNDPLVTPEVYVCGIPDTTYVDTNNLPSSWGFTLQDLSEAQAKDDDLLFIRSWLKNSIKPVESELFLASPAAKSYWLDKEQFLLIDEVLYQNDAASGEKKLMAPCSMQEDALYWNHDLPSAGHQGVARTTERVKEKFAWYRIGRDIANYVASCKTCNCNKKRDRHGHCPLTEYQAGDPMERIHIDFLGPLPKTHQGNEHILMVVDQFTKWVECIPLPSQTAEVTAKALVDCVFSRFGVPFQLHSDQGRNFESKLFSELCIKLGQLYIGLQRMDKLNGTIVSSWMLCDVS